MKYSLFKRSLKYFNETVKPRVFYKKVTIVEEVLDIKQDHIRNIENNKNDNKLLDLFGHNTLMSNHQYRIMLDDKHLKTRYLEDMIIPNKALALALSEEWATQTKFINYHSMQINLLYSSGTRLKNNKELCDSEIKRLIPYLETDQLLFIENKIIDKISDYYNTNLKARIELINNFWLDNFKFRPEYHYYNRHNNDFRPLLQVENIKSININDSEKHIHDLLLQFDPYVVSLLEILCGYTKSLILSMSLLSNIIKPSDVYLLSHSEELYQMIENGEVEGHHDLLHNTVQGHIYSSKVYFKLLKYFK